MDLFEKYGVTEQEVLEWGKKNYPPFAQNKAILLQLYLKSKGIEVDPRELAVVSGPTVSVAELVPGQWSNIEVLVGIKTRTIVYKGCPECGKKIEGAVCPECGAGAVDLRWEHYLAGDATGEIPITIPPSLAGDNLEGAVIKARGILRDDGFLVNAISISKPAQQQVTKADPAEVEMLKKVLEVFPDISEGELRTWHAQRKLKTPLEILLREAKK